MPFQPFHEVLFRRSDIDIKTLGKMDPPQTAYGNVSIFGKFQNKKIVPSILVFLYEERLWVRKEFSRFRISKGLIPRKGKGLPIKTGRAASKSLGIPIQVR